MRRGLTRPRRTRYTLVGTYVSTGIWRVHWSVDRIRRSLSVTATMGMGARKRRWLLAAFGYVALSIDGPGQGLSTGPPDTEQGWISVEQIMNVPAPYVSYLYHYAYAGMRALTLFEKLSGVFLNPFRIDRTRLGVIGASMGGQFTYYINGVDDRVKGAVGIAVAGDWRHISFYPGSWLYHGLYYYTRDGLPSGQDHLNTVSNFCTDPTLTTFLNYFDPIAYAPTQHGPLLTIVGTHDQFFTVPGHQFHLPANCQCRNVTTIPEADYDEAEREAWRREGRKFICRRA